MWWLRCAGRPGPVGVLVGSRRRYTSADHPTPVSAPHPARLASRRGAAVPGAGWRWWGAGVGVPARVRYPSGVGRLFVVCGVEAGRADRFGVRVRVRDGETVTGAGTVRA